MFLFSFQVFSGETVIHIEVEKSDEKGVVEKAVRKLSYELIDAILDPSRVEEKKKEINRIIRQKSNRYIFFTKKGSVYQKKGSSSSFVIPVTIGFSKENLKHILLESEIFYSDSLYIRVLPFIFLEDKVERKIYGWWVSGKKDTSIWQSNMSNFYNQLQSELMSYGFYVINPEFANFRHFIPKQLSLRFFKKKSIFNLAKHFNTHLVLLGSISIKEMDDDIFNIKADLTIYHVKSGRVLAEIERGETVTLSDSDRGIKDNKSLQVFSAFLERQKGFSKGLGMQMRALYQAGQMASNLLKITIQGKLTYRHFENFKNQLISKIESIKDLKENIIRSGAITYLVNTSSNTAEITPFILKNQFSGFNVKIKTVNRREIKLNVSLR